VATVPTPEPAPTATVDAPLLDAQGVQVTIGGTRILEHADLRVEAGRLVAVVGPNGAGKSTLARAVAGLQGISGGSVRWSGDAVSDLRGRELARRRAFVPQRGQVPAGVTVREAVQLGRAPHIGALRRATRHDQDVVEESIVRAGVSAFADRFLTTLSGGEVQRVQIAVALAQQAPVLMADEPTAHLDLGATATLARLLRGLTQDGIAVILVVHDLALAAAVADTVVVVAAGRTVATGAPADILDRELLADVWRVDAALQTSADGHTALHVDWLHELAAEPGAGER